MGLFLLRDNFHGRIRHVSRGGMTLVELMIASAVLSIMMVAGATLLYKTIRYQNEAFQVSESTEDMIVLGQFTKLLENSTGVICNCRGPNTPPRDTFAVDEDTRDCLFNDTDPETADVCQQGTWFDNAGRCSSDPYAPQTPVVVAGFISEMSPNPLEYTAKYMANTSIFPFYTSISKDPCFNEPGSTMYQAPTFGYGTATKIQTHGCQKAFQLVYTPPSRKETTVGGRASQPGSLELRDITYSLNGWDILSRFEGNSDRTSYLVELVHDSTFWDGSATDHRRITIGNIAAFRCGLIRENNPVPHSSQTGMKFFILQKILNQKPIAYPSPAPSATPSPPAFYTKNNAPMISSYHPSDSDFNAGPAIWRRITETIDFKNINQRGKHYGALQTRPCIANNTTIVGNYKDCCSQYVDSTMHCSYSCLPAGSGATVAGQCCSYDMNSSNICL